MTDNKRNSTSLGRFSGNSVLMTQPRRSQQLLGSSPPGSINRRFSVCSWCGKQPTPYIPDVLFFTLRFRHQAPTPATWRSSWSKNWRRRRTLSLGLPASSHSGHGMSSAFTRVGNSKLVKSELISCHPKISNKKVSGIPYFEFRFRYWFWVTSVFFLPRLKLKLIFEPFNLTKQLHTWSLRACTT
jgi:hypothetical protein